MDEVRAMDERDDPVRDPPRVERETTVINTGGGGGGSGGIIAILVLLVLAVIAFVLFSGVLDRSSDINVKIKTPDIELPDVPAPTKPSTKT